MAANTAGNQRGRPFVKGQSGCPAGKPKGARHRSTLAAEALLDGEAEQLMRKTVELALGGDTIALRLCLDRIIPPRGRCVLGYRPCNRQRTQPEQWQRSPLRWLPPTSRRARRPSCRSSWRLM